MIYHCSPDRDAFLAQGGSFRPIFNLSAVPEKGQLQVQRRSVNRQLERCFSALQALLREARSRPSRLLISCSIVLLACVWRSSACHERGQVARHPFLTTTPVSTCASRRSGALFAPWN